MLRTSSLRVALAVAPAFAWVPCALLPSACSHEEPAPPAEVERPTSLAGNAKDYGLTMKPLQVKSTDAGFDVRFEIGSSAKGIVELRSADSASGPEVELLVETFRRGQWRKETVAGADPKKLVELWPGGTQYGRAIVPPEARWARMVVTARGAVGKDGVAAPGPVEITSDAIELPSR